MTSHITPGCSFCCPGALFFDMGKRRRSSGRGPTPDRPPSPPPMTESPAEYRSLVLCTEDVSLTAASTVGQCVLTTLLLGLGVLCGVAWVVALTALAVGVSLLERGAPMVYYTTDTTDFVAQTLAACLELQSRAVFELVTAGGRCDGAAACAAFQTPA